MSVIDCDYLPADKVVFPPKLALLIVRKASAMAADFEEQVLDQLTKNCQSNPLPRRGASASHYGNALISVLLELPESW